MSYLSTRAGAALGAPSDGSRTITIHDFQPREGQRPNDDSSRGDGHGQGSGHRAESEEREDGPRVDGVLMLRGGRMRPRVTWTEDVVDNEGMGKKKSKSEYLICIAYIDLSESGLFVSL